MPRNRPRTTETPIFVVVPVDLSIAFVPCVCVCIESELDVFYFSSNRHHCVCLSVCSFFGERIHLDRSSLLLLLYFRSSMQNLLSFFYFFRIYFNTQKKITLHLISVQWLVDQRCEGALFDRK